MMRRSATIADLAMQAGIDVATAEFGRPDQRRGESGDLRQWGRVHGITPLILSGERSCLPHQTSRGETVKDRDLVYFEISASKWRYAAALMRTIFIGQPSDRERRCADAVIGAVDKAIETIRPGVTAEEVDRAARLVVEKAGFGEYWRHRLGYSIGVNYPRTGARARSSVSAGGRLENSGRG